MLHPTSTQVPERNCSQHQGFPRWSRIYDFEAMNSLDAELRLFRNCHNIPIFDLYSFPYSPEINPWVTAGISHIFTQSLPRLLGHRSIGAWAYHFIKSAYNKEFYSKYQ